MVILIEAVLNNIVQLGIVGALIGISVLLFRFAVNRGIHEFDRLRQSVETLRVESEKEIERVFRRINEVVTKELDRSDKIHTNLGDAIRNLDGHLTDTNRRVADQEHRIARLETEWTLVKKHINERFDRLERMINNR